MSAAAAKAKRGAGVSLEGSRPQPLSLPNASPPRPSKRPRANGGGEDGVVGPPAPAGPVIVYEHTPKVIHARPDEFKALVQRLTGRQQWTTTGGQEAVVLLPAQTATAHEETGTAGGDPLVLKLGQQAPAPLDDDYTLPLPSPGGGGLAAAGFLLSPGSFLFSPNTMKALQELIS
ncbi:hypothetical protein BAE44_0020200 [Dichanthelium oligosanthes]|uniref:VQ domain-containing protein n=1 Tax=Dichanthelium oligosanthes TaxID=888268 RepID=A0A1E5V0Z6_9POAL|nr:hypothetical protein BAE44_0020200 [Dichanthelium oligosanthes]